MLYAIGYNRWPAKQRLERMLAVLQNAHIDIVVDVRLSPSSSQSSPHSNYGPRPWHLLAQGAGLDGHLRHEGIEYAWLPELGNPQKSSGNTEILQAHLADGSLRVPVNRGLIVLKDLIDSGKSCCLLCACGKYDQCHRKVIAEAFNERFFGGKLEIKDLSMLMDILLT